MPSQGKPRLMRPQSVCCGFNSGLGKPDHRCVEAGLGLAYLTRHANGAAAFARRAEQGDQARDDVHLRWCVLRPPHRVAQRLRWSQHKRSQFGVVLEPLLRRIEIIDDEVAEVLRSKTERISVP